MGPFTVRAYHFIVLFHSYKVISTTKKEEEEEKSTNMKTNRPFTVTSAIVRAIRTHERSLARDHPAIVSIRSRPRARANA